MIPRLYISTFSLQTILFLPYVIISGATYPGVPHRTKIVFSRLKGCANPKSAITTSQFTPDYLTSIFSGFRSLCIIFKLCMYYIPSNNSQKILLISSIFKCLVSFIFFFKSPPSNKSIISMIQDSFSYTSCNLIIFGCFNFYKIVISCKIEIYHFEKK